MNTPRTDSLEKTHPSPREQRELCAQLETELAAVIAERDDAIQRYATECLSNDLFAQLQRAKQRADAAECACAELRMVVAEFCKGQQWADAIWKAQPHIKPLFDLCSTK
jgi:hypothetical protein